jgi:hypothetical protein
MFRKLVTNLSFSPTLIGELGHYAKRIRREERMRVLGLIFVVLALIVQYFAIFRPPEPANAASSQDLIYGGIATRDELLRHYQHNDNNLRDIYTAAGITEQEIMGTREGSVNSKNAHYISGRQSRVGYQDGERTLAYTKTPSGTGTVYFSPLQIWDTTPYEKLHGTTYPAFIGQSQKAGRFAIMKRSGQLALTTLPSSTPVSPGMCALHTSLSTSDKDCIPCVSQPSLWIQDSRCTTQIIQTLSADDTTTRRASADTPAQPNDRVVYTITAENTGTSVGNASFSINLTDTLEYSEIVDNGGGSFDPATKILSWPSMTLAPSQKQTHSFTTHILSTIPDTPRGASNPSSYDCQMTMTYGSTVTLPVTCGGAKIIESLIGEFPRIGTTVNSILGATLLITTLFLYLRTRQQREEIRLIRKDANTGTL